MALYKRNDTWWTDFSVNGQRFRESVGTSAWREAQAKQKELISQASQGKLSAGSQQLGRLAFSQAADVYVAERQHHLASRSIQTEKERLKPLKAHFGATCLNRISADSVRQYVAERKAANLSNRTINMEVACLARILRRAKRWHLIADEIEPLPERQDIARVLTPEQKAKLLKTALSKPEWQIAQLAMTLALNTTMRACEIRGLRWRDIDARERVITVQKSKTRAGLRLIPLNNDASAAILQLRRRTRTLLGRPPLPDWYVFPRAEGNTKPDPTRPMSTWRTAWRRLTREAGLSGLRFHDLRHHAITELAESSTSEQTIMSIAGHVSAKMLAHYSHVRLEAKRNALAALSSGSETDGYVTIDVTKEPLDKESEVQVVEKVVDVTGIEPVTPCLQSSRLSSDNSMLYF
jgi:integrase